jgi:hypothetical protein
VGIPAFSPAFFILFFWLSFLKMLICLTFSGFTPAFILVFPMLFSGFFSLLEMKKHEENWMENPIFTRASVQFYFALNDYVLLFKIKIYDNIEAGNKKKGLRISNQYLFNRILVISEKSLCSYFINSILALLM